MFEVSEITFLTPAKVTWRVDGQEYGRVLNVDIKNRIVYDDQGDRIWSEEGTKAFFAKLDQIMNPPENLYANGFGSDKDVNNIKEKIEQIQDCEAWETK
jgi:hypothetical protein